MACSLRLFSGNDILAEHDTLHVKAVQGSVATCEEEEVFVVVVLYVMTVKVCAICKETVLEEIYAAKQILLITARDVYLNAGLTCSLCGRLTCSLCGR